MTFKPEKVDDFLYLFDKTKEKIRGFEGLKQLDLYRDIQQSNLFFTYSVWDEIDHLEAYRKSALFKNVWSKTRALFEKKAEAWSVNTLHSL